MPEYPPAKCARGNQDTSHLTLVASVDDKPGAFLGNRHGKASPQADDLSVYDGFARVILQRHPGQIVRIRNAAGAIVSTAK